MSVVYEFKIFLEFKNQDFVNVFQKGHTAKGTIKTTKIIQFFDNRIISRQTTFYVLQQNS